MRSNLSVREIQEQDILFIADYWLNSEPDHLTAMGVDLAKLPTREEITDMLQTQLSKPIHEKQSFCMIWEVDGKPVGHSNVNKITFADEAYMHLHLWNNSTRKQGFGAELVKLTLPYFFEKLHLETLYCEPYALNPAPNCTLQKVGFELEKEYTTIPGTLNFEQPVKRWKLGRSKFEELSKA